MLKYRTRIAFPSFDVPRAAYGGIFNAMSPKPLESAEWYAGFRERCLESVGRSFLPVYRMADGEFLFLVGDKLHFTVKGFPRQVASFCLRTLGLGVDRSSGKWRLTRRNAYATIWGESYLPAERSLLLPVYLGQLHEIARRGYLAAFLIENSLGYCKSQIADVLRTFSRNGIKLTVDNYVPFHFPLYMLTAADCSAFYNKRSVLVVSSFGAEAKASVAAELQRKGAKEVSFLRISPTHSMFDKINPSDVRPPVDIALVAAGIGSSNILPQLAFLDTLVVDVGGLLTCIARPGWKYHEFIEWHR